jgi:hypothetical protein
MVKLAPAAIATLFLLSWAIPSMSHDTRRIVPSSSPATEEIWLHPNTGVSVSYIGIEQTIETVWLDNKSRILLSTDGCLSGLNARCTRNSANVVHLSRAGSALFKGRGENSMLTVITADSGGKRYTYRYAVKVTNRPANEQTVTLIEYILPRDLASQPARQNARTVILPPAILGKRLRVAAQRAKNEGRLFDPALIRRTDTFIELVESGVNPQSAAQQAGLSAEYVNALYKLSR